MRVSKTVLLIATMALVLCVQGMGQSAFADAPAIIEGRIWGDGNQDRYFDDGFEGGFVGVLVVLEGWYDAEWPADPDEMDPNGWKPATPPDHVDVAMTDADGFYVFPMVPAGLQVALTTPEWLYFPALPGLWSDPDDLETVTYGTPPNEQQFTRPTQITFPVVTQPGTPRTVDAPARFGGPNSSFPKIRLTGGLSGYVFTDELVGGVRDGTLTWDGTGFLPCNDSGIADTLLANQTVGFRRIYPDVTAWTTTLTGYAGMNDGDPLLINDVPQVDENGQPIYLETGAQGLFEFPDVLPPPPAVDPVTNQSDPDLAKHYVYELAVQNADGTWGPFRLVEPTMLLNSARRLPSVSLTGCYAGYYGPESGRGIPDAALLVPDVRQNLGFVFIPLNHGLHTIEGHVLDPDAAGGPAPLGMPVTVDLYFPGTTSTPIRTTTTDASGHYAFTGVDEGPWVVRIAHPDTGDVFRKVTLIPENAVDETRTLDFDVDRTAPRVSIASPGDGYVVAGTITIEASLVDLNAASLTLLVDGVEVGTTTADTTLQIDFDTTTVLDGEVTITAVGEDAFGNEGSAAVDVHVMNGASVLSSLGALNLKSKGKYVTVVLESAVVAALIPTEDHAIALCVPGGGSVPSVHGFAGDDDTEDSDGDGIPELVLKFDRQGLIAVIPADVSKVALELRANGSVLQTVDLKIVGRSKGKKNK